jgi:hypothetical protein
MDARARLRVIEEARPENWNASNGAPARLIKALIIDKQPLARLAFCVRYACNSVDAREDREAEFGAAKGNERNELGFLCQPNS